MLGFFVFSDFDVWKDICNSEVDDFIAKYSTLFTAFLKERRKAFDARYHECKTANRMSRSIGVSGLQIIFLTVIT